MCVLKVCSTALSALRVLQKYLCPLCCPYGYRRNACSISAVLMHGATAPPGP